ncbi:MAG: phage tail sheath C-terminal domain-containing protein [Methanothrix sp.]
MPSILSYPGVYIEELESGVRTIAGVATSITAFVGYAPQGPLNEAVRIFNFGEYERNFGGLHKDSEIGYAVQQFFINGGRDAYVVRVAQGSGKAKVVLKNILIGDSQDDVLNVEALNSGAWGNNIRMDVDYATSNPDSTFNLTVSQFEKRNGKQSIIQTELFRNLSMNSYSSTFALSVVNSSSKMIRIERSNFIYQNMGYSLSKKLSNPDFSLNEQTKNIELILDGSERITLELGSPLPTKIDELKQALNDAIQIAAPGKLEAIRTDATGNLEIKGDFVKLNSLTKVENSSVEVLTAAANDAAKALGLGLANGGRESEGASAYRPAPTGTISGDIAAKLGTTTKGNLQIDVLTNPPSSTPLTATINLSDNTAVGPDLAACLQDKIRKVLDLNNKSYAALEYATVTFNGSIIRVVPSADTPNATITLGGEVGTFAEFSPQKGYTNIQQYSLGVGAESCAQTNASSGADGMPPSDASIITGSYEEKTGIYALRDVDLFNLLVIPRASMLNSAPANEVITKAIAFCEERRAFFLIDPPQVSSMSVIKTWVESIAASKNSAVYFPRIMASDPLDQSRVRPMPASGAIAGIFARTDAERGIWKAPAGIDAVLKGVQALSYKMTDLENGVLNVEGINCLRTFPVYGSIVWGARTRMGADARTSEWKYIPVRRLALYIEESLYRGTQWVVFEPNDEPLWSQIRLNIGAFMHNLFRQGAFQGRSAREAYFVKCDKETTTQTDIDAGIVNILVGFAPLKPAEFVVIKIQQMTGQMQS